MSAPAEAAGPVRRVNFPAAVRLYALDPEAAASDALDQLSARASQLSAMLDLSYGGGFESFKVYSEATQENYLWLAASLAGEIEELVQLYGELRAKERAAAEASGSAGADQ